MVYPKNRKPRPLVEYICTVCGSKFNSRSNIRKYCDECAPKESKRTKREWWQLHKGYCKKEQRKNAIKRLYGITLKDYEVMFTKQKGLCAICDKPHKILCIDHNHNTGKVRGLLCKGCNLSIGRLENRWDRIIEYLKED